MTLHVDGAWTMDGFLRWEFGPRYLAHLAVLVEQAQQRLQCLRAVPGDRAVRKQLLSLMHEIRTRADTKLYGTEADIAASLSSLLHLPDLEPWALDRLSTGCAGLARCISGRLADFARLLQGSAVPAGIAA